MSTGPGILVVEDEPAVMRALAVALESQGYRPIPAATGTQAVARAAAEGPEVVLRDRGLPDVDGLEVIRRVRADRPAGAPLAHSVIRVDPGAQRCWVRGQEVHLTRPSSACCSHCRHTRGV